MKEIIKNAVCLLYFNKDNNILGVKRIKSNSYGLPGGKVDGYESLEQALVRELKEETNISILASQLIPIYSAFVKGFYCTTFILKDNVKIEEEKIKQCEDHIIPEFIEIQTLLINSEFVTYNNGVLESLNNLLEYERGK